MGDLLDDYDATGLADLIARGDVSPVELVEAAIARIEAFDPRLNAVIHRQFDRALREAAASLPEGPFTGVPFLFKDLGCEEAGEPHHQGMQVLRDAGWCSPHDSPLALRFRSLGFVPVGRTNTPELALMGTTEPESYGPTHNPWSLDRSPGGSSGGSGAAVAAGFVPIAHANDIAGSIRIPASQCGVVGLKPSRGRVVPNRAGDAAVTMLTEGAITRTIRDTAGVLDGLAESSVAERLVDEVGRDPGRLRVGLCLHAFTGVDVDAGCVEAARSAARLMEGLGHDVEEAWPAALYDPDLLPGATNLAAAHTAAAVDAWSAALGRDLGEGDVEPASWSLIARGRGLSGVDVMRALQRQEELTREVGQLVARVRPIADADDRGARSSARRLQEGLRARSRQRVHARVQRDGTARAVSPPRMALRRPAPRRAARCGLRARRRAHPRRGAARSRPRPGPTADLPSSDTRLLTRPSYTRGQ